jgi:hypothetical protein
MFYKCFEKFLKKVLNIRPCTILLHVSQKVEIIKYIIIESTLILSSKCLYDALKDTQSVIFEQNIDHQIFLPPS